MHNRKFTLQELVIVITRMNLQHRLLLFSGKATVLLLYPAASIKDLINTTLFKAIWKCRLFRLSIFKMSAFKIVDFLKCRLFKLSTSQIVDFQNVDLSNCWRLKMSTFQMSTSFTIDQNVDSKNVDFSKLKNSIEKSRS